jgi:hypothetical protein
MELPIVGFPSYVEELCVDFTHIFNQERQFIHFIQLMAAYVNAERNTIAHMNGLFTFHSNQSNLNRFITNANWDEFALNSMKINMINQVESDGVLILDDYITEKCEGEAYYGGRFMPV